MKKGRVRIVLMVKAMAKVAWKPVTHLDFTLKHEHNDGGEGGAPRVGAAVFIWPFVMNGSLIFMVSSGCVQAVVADK
jgi:hypothetical protein